MVENLQELDMDLIWEEALEKLSSHPDIPESRYKSLCVRMSPLGFTPEGTFTLGVPNNFFQRLVEKTCFPPIVDTLQKITKRSDIKVIIKIDESVASNYEVAPIPPELNSSSQDFTNSGEFSSESGIFTRLSNSATAAGTAAVTSAVSGSTISHSNNGLSSYNSNKNKFDDIKIDPYNNFESFIVGESNNFAYTSALNVSESPGKIYNPLFIWGDSGLGKTHLLHAIGNHIAEMYPEKRIVCTSAKNFTEQFIKSISSTKLNENSRRAEEMRNHYRDTDLLLIDDIQDLKGVETTNQFFHTFNALKENRKQIVLVADRSPEELKLDERFTSRFKSGLMVDVLPPSYEMRCAILKKFTQGMEKPFTDDAIDLIAEKSSDNIRELEGAAIRASAWAKINKQAVINADVVKKATVGFFPERKALPISIPNIQNAVCRFYGVTHADLTGKKRKQEIVFPRHVAMFLCSELTDSSTPQIGKSFGGKDHTTVMHAVDKIKKKRESENETYEQIEHLTKMLRTKQL